MSFEPSGVARALLPTAVSNTLGEYELLTKLASGGMATVYVGRKCGAAGFERLVALKCCHPHLRDDEHFVSMFLDEARLAASIRHPNVVATLDVSDGARSEGVRDECSTHSAVRRQPPRNTRTFRSPESDVSANFCPVGRRMP